MSADEKPPVYPTAPFGVPSVDLSQTHLKTVHVIAIVTAIIAAGLAVARTYISVTWQVEKLTTEQADRPTKKDLEALHTSISSDMTHAASERVKFYMEHGKLECDPPTKRGGKTTCHMVWPPPQED